MLLQQYPSTYRPCQLDLYIKQKQAGAFTLQAST